MEQPQFPDPWPLFLLELGSACLGIALGMFLQWWRLRHQRREPLPDWERLLSGSHPTPPPFPAAQVQPEPQAPPVTRPPWAGSDRAQEIQARLQRAVRQAAELARREQQGPLLEQFLRLGQPRHRLELLRGRLQTVSLQLAQLRGSLQPGLDLQEVQVRLELLRALEQELQRVQQELEQVWDRGPELP